MGSIKFIEIETVFDLHEQGIQRFGGSRRLRDQGMIESALGAAQNAFYYGTRMFSKSLPPMRTISRKRRRSWMETNVSASPSRLCFSRATVIWESLTRTRSTRL
ncbi:MAG: hypothetical protein M3Y03_00600 [Verrucomicrobiota bacterium]|nr:hypothetical protein [Verrucomicrobiota bacterium]